MQTKEQTEHETMEVDPVELARTINLMSNNSAGRDIGRVMKEGGVVFLDGKARYFTAAPKWVFHLLARGIYVDMGAWCREATAAASDFLEKLDQKYNTGAENAEGI